MVGVGSVIARQYPHYLYVRESGPATKQANGDYVPGASRWVAWGMCREETNGKGAEIITADQKTYKFASLVQCPAGTQRVPEGTMVLVSNRRLCCWEPIDEHTIKQDGTARIIAKCAKFDQGRLHCRLWL